MSKYFYNQLIIFQGVFDRLSDTTKFVGTARYQFNEQGVGLGRAGREDIKKNDGYVQGFSPDPLPDLKTEVYQQILFNDCTVLIYNIRNKTTTLLCIIDCTQMPKKSHREIRLHHDQSKQLPPQNLQEKILVTVITKRQ